MALVAKALRLDITPGAIQQVVNVSEYDENREYTVSLIDEGGVFEIPSGTTAKVEGSIGGNAFSESATVSGNTITFTLTESMTALAGDVWCKIKLTKDSKPIQTAAFILRCDKAGVEADTIINAQGFDEKIQNAVDSHMKAEGLGVVRYDLAETLTDAQKTQARGNIDAASATLESDFLAYPDSVSAALGDFVTPMVFRSGYYKCETKDSGKAVTYAQDSGYVCAKCAVSKGDTVVINASGGSGAHRLYDILDSNDRTIRYANNNTSGPLTVKINYDDAAAIIVNNNLTSQSNGYYAYRGMTVAEKIVSGAATMDTIASYGTDGVFTGDFTVTIPFSGDSRNQIFTCEAMYTLEDGAPPPTIQFALGSGLNVTTRFELGAKGYPLMKQWRVVRYPSDETPLEIRFLIPSGCSVTITEFRSDYSNDICRADSGIRLNAHRRMPTTPYDTIQSAILAAKAGYPAMIQIPKRTSDGVWICSHDDTISLTDTTIREADGTALPSSYDGKRWSEITYAEAYSWDWGISKDVRYSGTKPMTLEQFFVVCAKTGMKPMLSVHPLPSAEELAEVKELARKCGVLHKLGIKAPSSSIAPLYAAFGNDVESYTLDVSSSSATSAFVTYAIGVMNGLENCTARKVIELLKVGAYNAYFGETQFDPFGMIADAGIGCAIAIEAGEGSPTGYAGRSQFIYGADMEWWATNHGVTEFTDEYNWSAGLNW